MKSQDFSVREISKGNNKFPFLFFKKVTNNLVKFHEIIPARKQLVQPLILCEGAFPKRKRAKIGSSKQIDFFPLGFYAISKAFVYGYGVVTDNQNTILHADNLTFNKVNPERLKRYKSGLEYFDNQIKSREKRIIRKIVEPLVMIVQPGIKIYGHWLIDIIPKLYLVKDRILKEGYKILLPNTTPNYFERLLKWIGLTADHVIFYDPQEEVISCEKLIIPTKCRAKDGSWLASFIGPLYDEIIQNNILVPVAKGNRLLYLSRGKIKNKSRQLINRSEIEDILNQFSFEEIFIEDYSLSEQIQLCQEAKIIIGEFGSALHNSLFAKQDLLVFSLQSNHVPLLVQWGVCNIKKQKCGIIFGEATEKKARIASNFSIDPAIVKQTLAKYI